MATSKINQGFAYSTYKGSPKVVTIPTGGNRTDITNPVTIPEGTYFVRLSIPVHRQINYAIIDSNGNDVCHGSSSAGEYCTMFRTTSGRTVRGTAQNWSTDAYQTSDDGNYFGLFLTRLGG